MNKLIKLSAYNAELTIPSSKSYMQRAVALAILADGKSVLKNPDFSNDSKAAIKIAENLGCKIEQKANCLEINPSGKILSNEISVGEAGLGLRLFTPVCSLWGEKIIINGHGSLVNRPMDFMIKPLENLGVSLKTNNGFIPFEINGKLIGGVAEIDGSQSSQFLTGLLTALPLTKNDSQLIVKNLKSIPYVDMTLDIIKKFGGEIENKNYEVFNIKGNQRYKGTDYTVEGDWSSVAAHLVAGAITGKSTIYGLNPASLQADKAILQVLINCGAHLEIDSEKIVVTKNQLNAFKFDATNSPDLFPVLAALAAQCNGTSIIKGVSRLANKESNRALAIRDEYEKLGIKIILDNDFMHIVGGKIKGAKTSSHNDHRMAMSLAISALMSDGDVEIAEAEAVNKSYPRFWDDFEKSVVKK